jgi:DNA mismatch repair protein MutL
MKSQIRKLPSQTISKIAAGEVVDRPAAVVKELVENSIDANAGEISIKIGNGGIDLIEIADNGSGIAKADLPLALELHATSKLTDIQELLKIETMGFRGEALASINAAADVEIVSAYQNEDAYKMANGEITPAGRDQGTTIIIKNLFRKIPARRKFLKTHKTEEGKIRDVVKKFAIVHPEIAFKYEVEGREIFNTNRNERQKQRIAELYNFDEDKLFSINHTTEQISISGFIGDPSTASKRSQQHVFINRRIVRSPLVASAVKRAYANKLPPELNPMFFINIDIDPEVIDINIHPRKEEVKFSNEGSLFKQILTAVNNSLGENMRKQFEQRFSPIAPKQSMKEREGFSRRNQQTPPKQTHPNKNSNSNSYSVDKAMKFSDNILKDRTQSTNNSKNSNFSQLFKTYVVFENEDKLIFVDQHAADERVKYEKLMKNYEDSDEVKSMPLLIEEKIKVRNTSLEKAEISEIKNMMKKLGFALSCQLTKETVTVRITEVPIILSGKLNLNSIIEELFSRNETGGNKNSVEEKLDHIIATMACHSSIRAGETIHPEKLSKLVSDLWSCTDPYTCPHGRPIVWELSRSELEKNFLRQK